jgi:preprotein translocase subunit SecG
VYTLLVILFIIVCFFLILVVLLQQGQGADVAAAFGGAGAQTSFGPRGSTTLMHKLTTGSFVAFVVLSIMLSVVTERRGRSVTAGIKGKPPAAAPTSVPAANTPQKPAEKAPAPAAPQSAPAPAKTPK